MRNQLIKRITVHPKIPKTRDKIKFSDALPRLAGWEWDTLPDVTRETTEYDYGKSPPPRYSTLSKGISGGRKDERAKTEERDTARCMYVCALSRLGHTRA